MTHVATRSINIIEFCAGAAGLGLALKLVYGKTARTICYCERESHAAANLVARMEDSTLDSAPIWDDLTTMRGECWRGLVDIFAAGFPCQPWSAAGDKKGIADERWLWPDLAKRIREMGPPVVWLENVPGLVYGGGLEYVLSDLAAMGYHAEWDSFAAEDVGGTHRRERIYIVAWRDDGLATLADAVRLGRCVWDAPGEHAADALQPGQVLVDTQSELLGPGLREAGAEQSRGQFGDTGGAVADAQHLSGCSEQLDQSRGRPTSQPGQDPMPERSRQGSVREMADAGSPGLQGGELCGEPGTAGGRPGVDGAATAQLCRAPVEDASSQRSRPMAEAEGRQPDVDPRWSVPIFPPGPNEIDRWRDILRIAPSLEPAICGVADELAHRVDRLRLCGNGVFPLGAAVAFTLLAHRALNPE